MYQRAFARDPSERETMLAMGYLETGTLTGYAQALLGTNEVIFWR
jgi:hypothetical protein